MKENFPGILLLFKIISFSIISWILIHFLAIFGFFLAIAYPIWWFFAPANVPCFGCRGRKAGSRCLFCRQPIVKENISPKSLSSVFLNAALIMAVTLISIGVVFLEGRVLFQMGFPPTRKTVSFVIPSKGQYRLGEIFPMDIEIVGIEIPVNAVQADIAFDASRLEVMEVFTDNSFASIFIQKEIDNENGYTRLTGGLPNPGFFSDHGIFGTIFFKGKIPGLVKVDFLPTSLVLANDGRGSNILKDLASASYLILPEKIGEEEAVQQQAMLGPRILGETIDETKIRLWEDKDQVLGLQTQKEIGQEKKFSVFRFLANILEKIVSFTFSFWDKTWCLFVPRQTQLLAPLALSFQRF